MPRQYIQYVTGKQINNILQPFNLKKNKTDVKKYKREVSCVYLQIYSILDT